MYTLPAELKVPELPLKCHCKDHLELTHFDATIPMPAKLVFDVLYGEQSELFWKKVDAHVGVEGLLLITVFC
jgi:hypothetical protein